MTLDHDVDDDDDDDDDDDVSDYLPQQQMPQDIVKYTLMSAPL